MSYKTFLLCMTLTGFIPAVLFLYYFLVVDRGPSRWDRYSMFIVGLASVALLNYGGVIVTLLTGGPWIARTPPQTIGGWIGTVVLRGIAALLMWALLGIYLSPPKRNGAGDSNSREKRSDDTPKPGSLPTVK